MKIKRKLGDITTRTMSKLSRVVKSVTCKAI